MFALGTPNHLLYFPDVVSLKPSQDLTFQCFHLDENSQIVGFPKNGLFPKTLISKEEAKKTSLQNFRRCWARGLEVALEEIS